VHRYCSDYNKAVGYLIVFDVSEKHLRVDLRSSGGIPQFEYSHKTIFLVSIDICEHVGTASVRDIPETVSISESELVREIEAVREGQC
jgi:hypothetical protein